MLSNTIESFSHIVPDPQVTLTLNKPHYDVGDTAILTCRAKINSSIAMNIDEDISVTMEVNGVPLNTPIRKQSSLQYSSTHAVPINDTTVATQYTCRVTITSTSQYIIANNNSMASADLIVQC